MLIAGWSLTNACNLRCEHCYNRSGSISKKELNTKQIFMVADKLKEAKVKAVNFGGGECPLRKDFIILCKYLTNNLGLKISLTTNGTTYGLFKNHLDMFCDIGVSIDFVDEKRHDAFRGKKGVHKKALATIKDMVKNNVNTEIVTCLTKINSDIKNLRGLYDLSKNLGVDSWRINRYRPTGRSGGLVDNRFRLKPKDLKAGYEFLRSVTEDNFKCNTSDPIYRILTGGKSVFRGCPCGTYSFRIRHNGDVSPCVYLKSSGGNILNRSIAEIMNSDIFKGIQNRVCLGKCKVCRAYDTCKGGCAGQSFIELGHFNGPDPLCWFDPKKVDCEGVKIQGSDSWNVHELYLCTAYVPINKG